MAFKMAGYSPFDKNGDTEPKDPNKIRITSGNYKTGDMVKEDDFENSPSFGDGVFPENSVEDYSTIKMDKQGAYVTKLKE